MKEISNIDRALSNPSAVVPTLSPTETRLALAKSLVATMALIEKWARDEEDEYAAKQRATGDRLLGTKEMCERIGCSMSTLMAGWKKREFPFMFKRGGRLKGSVDGLERWIEARTSLRGIRGSAHGR